MRVIAFLAAISLTLGASGAFAAVDNSASFEYVGRLNIPTHPYIKASGDANTVNTEGGAAASVEKNSSAAFEQEFGTQFRLKSESAGHQVKVDSAANWSEPGNPNTSLNSFFGSVFGRVTGSERLSGPGYVRFKVDYDLAVQGENSYAYYSLDGSIFGQAEGVAPSLYRAVYGTSTGVQQTGSDQTEWFYFKDIGALEEASFSYTAFAKALTEAAPPALLQPVPPGSATSHAYIQVSYEVMPIPEPENYTLLLFGLAGLLAVKRRRA